MAFDRVRSAEDRLADSAWHRGERIGYWIMLVTLGCVTFAWFGIHALRQFHTAGRDRDETWAAVWGGVALVSWWLGAGLVFGTTQEAGISVLVWALRIGSLFHVHADHVARMRARALDEVARERTMITDALGHPGLRPAGQHPAGPRPTSRAQAPATVQGGGRFGAPDTDPFAAGPHDVGAVRDAPRGRSWGRLGTGAPAPGRGRRLESPAPDPWAAGLPADDASGTPMWVPGLEPGDATPRGGDGRGDPAAPPSGRILDL